MKNKILQVRDTVPRAVQMNRYTFKKLKLMQALQ